MNDFDKSARREGEPPVVFGKCPNRKCGAVFLYDGIDGCAACGTTRVVRYCIRTFTCSVHGHYDVMGTIIDLNEWQKNEEEAMECPICGRQPGS